MGKKFGEELAHEYENMAYLVLAAVLLHIHKKYSEK
jgi:hypothetical protein